MISNDYEPENILCWKKQIKASKLSNDGQLIVQEFPCSATESVNVKYMVQNVNQFVIAHYRECKHKVPVES